MGWPGAPRGGMTGMAYGGGGGYGGPPRGMGGCWGPSPGKGGCKGYGGPEELYGGKGGFKGYGGPMAGYGPPGYGAARQGYGGPNAYGGKGPYGPPGGYMPPAAAEPEIPNPRIEVVWISLMQPSQITNEGFPPDAPALTYDKAAAVFSNGHSILQEVVGDIAAEVQIVHDPDWEQFPEVAAAVKEAGGEENCISVATCPNEGKWAVGVGNGKMGRERAAKTAMALALVAGTDRLEKVANDFPEFASLCVDAGLLSSMPQPQKPQGGKAQGSKDAWGPGNTKHQQWALEPPAAQYGGQEESSPPCVHWLTLELTSKLVAEAGFPPEGLAVGHDKTYADAFRSAHHVLGELVGNVTEAVQFTHDPDWVEFPEIAKALKETGGEENCFCVATCPSAGKWAVGLASGWKNRESACKLALSLVLAADADSLASICQKYPELGGFCSCAGLAPAAMPEKRRKVEPQYGGWKTGGGKGKEPAPELTMWGDGQSPPPLV